MTTDDLQRDLQDAIRNAQTLDEQAAAAWQRVKQIRNRATPHCEVPYSAKSPVPAPTHAGRADGSTTGLSATGRRRA